MRTLQEVFQKGLDMHHYTNTAYPITPTSFREFKVKGKEEVDKFVIEQWKAVDEMGLYVHIPFCLRRCNFCEYCVYTGDDADQEDLYIELLLKEIEMYGKALSPKKISGLDIGGGTPSIIKVENIQRILDALEEQFGPEAVADISIETTPRIAAKEPEKMAAYKKMGIDRISMGIQTVDPKLLDDFQRHGSTRMYYNAKENIRQAGFDQFNIDVMYGFLNQSLESFCSTLEFTLQLNPEHITLYRNRYKDTKLEPEAKEVSLEKVNAQYAAAYDMLIKAGFHAHLGKNTFSRIKGAMGTSYYMNKRVMEGMPYLGLGTGSQSYFSNSISYNQGAASKKLSGYKKWIEQGHFPIQDVYDLPVDEIAAKMICVSFYYGFINKVHFENRTGQELEEMYAEEIAFLLEHGMVAHRGVCLDLTHKGKDNIGGVIALFYSKKEQEKMYEYADKLGVC